MAQRTDQTISLRLFQPEEVQLDPDTKLGLIRTRLGAAMRTRAQRCHSEATALSHDMMVVAERIDDGGAMADIDSVRVAGYHINQTELLVLRKVWLMVSSIMNGKDCEVDSPGVEEDQDD